MALHSSSFPYFVLTAVLLGPVALRAADEAPAEPGPRMLYNHLIERCRHYFDQRRQAVAALKTPDDVRRRQDELRRRFWEALGDRPERTPLAARVIGGKRCDGYRLERVVYESRPHHHITAIFYIPEGQGPFPGVLVPCGHSANGKAAEPYQRVCILMAKNGLAVLCYDPIGQGERSQLLDQTGKPAIAGSTSEHTMCGLGALLVGRSTAGYRVWDGIRSLDYLASRPEVDPKRLGCTGNSGGGTLTAYLMALDDRIVAAAPSCYVTSLERLFATIGPQDAEQNITGQVAYGMEHADYVTMRAPRPTLVLTGTQDYFDIQGAWTSFREAKLLYGLLGHGERVDLFEYNDKHGFSKPRREAAMRWMRRWLLNKDDAPAEGEFAVQKDEELQCTRTGQVLEDFKGKSVFDLNRQRERELAGTRAKYLASVEKDALLARVERMLAIPEKRVAAQLRRTDAENWVFETEPGIVVPAVVVRPAPGKARSGLPVLYLDPEGRDRATRPGGPVAKLAEEGRTVIAADLRGMGASAPRLLPPGRPNLFGVDNREAFLSLHLARPLLGQRVFDVLALVDRLAREKGFEAIHVVGVGQCGAVALHAAALEPRVKEITLERSFVSWSAVVHMPICHDQLSTVIPGVLAWYDLPDLAARLAPRDLTVRSPVTPVGQPLTRAAAEAAYESCRKAYDAQNAARRFTISP